MGRVELRGDLNAVVAGMVRSKVDRLASEVERVAMEKAPAAKVWLTREDERVRPSHEKAHEQTIPENLRFKLRKEREKRNGQTELAQGFDLGRKPRDPDLPLNQRQRCRCESVVIPGLIARKIQRSAAVVTSGRVSARVEVEFPRIVESEHGTDDDQAARFLGGALDVVAAQLRAKARRT